MTQIDIVDVDLTQMANEVCEVAGEIKQRKFIAFAMIGCTSEGDAVRLCFVDPRIATHDLLDEMVHDAKKMLFESHEAGK